MAWHHFARDCEGVGAEGANGVAGRSSGWSPSVTSISSNADEGGSRVGSPYQLADNENRSFQGSILVGVGFLLTP